MNKTIDYTKRGYLLNAVLVFYTKHGVKGQGGVNSKECSCMDMLQRRQWTLLCNKWYYKHQRPRRIWNQRKTTQNRKHPGKKAG